MHLIACLIARWLIHNPTTSSKYSKIFMLKQEVMFSALRYRAGKTRFNRGFYLTNPRHFTEKWTWSHHTCGVDKSNEVICVIFTKSQVNVLLVPRFLSGGWETGTAFPGRIRGARHTVSVLREPKRDATRDYCTPPWCPQQRRAHMSVERTARCDVCDPVE
jgi:hypothetical protein